MTRANPVFIGSFILGAVVLALAGIFVFGSGKLLVDTVSCVMYFDGAVQGLHPGAAVNFRGVKIGTVQDIRMQFNPQTLEIHIPVIVAFPKGAQKRMDMEITPGAPSSPQDALKALVERGLRAQLQTESLVTGQLFIQLNFYGYDPLAGNGMQAARVDPATRLLEIPTIPTTLQEISQTARKALDVLAELPLKQMVIDLSDTLHSVRELVSDPTIPALLRQASTTLVQVQLVLQRVDTEVERVGSSATTALHTLDKLETDTQQLVRQLSKDVGRLASSATTALGAVSKLLQQAEAPLTGLLGKLGQQADKPLTELLRRLQEVASTGQTTLGQAQDTLIGLQQVLTPQAPLGYELLQTLRELAEAGRSLRVLADYLERHPSSVVFGRNEGKGQ